MDNILPQSLKRSLEECVQTIICSSEYFRSSSPLQPYGIECTTSAQTRNSLGGVIRLNKSEVESSRSGMVDVVLSSLYLIATRSQTHIITAFVEQKVTPIKT